MNIYKPPHFIKFTPPMNYVFLAGSIEMTDILPQVFMF